MIILSVDNRVLNQDGGKFYAIEGWNNRVRRNGRLAS